jgi:hypothetical protein
MEFDNKLRSHDHLRLGKPLCIIACCLCLFSASGNVCVLPMSVQLELVREEVCRL